MYPILYKFDKVNENWITLELTKKTLNPKEIFILDNGMEIFIWIGNQYNINIVKELNNHHSDNNCEESQQIYKFVNELKR